MKPWETNFRKVDPYVPGEQPQCQTVLKLNTNENAYPPAPKVIQRMKTLNADRLKLYPDYRAEKLVRNLADLYHVEENQVFVGIGSDDVLATAFLTFFNSDQPILFPDITYSFYKVWAQLYRIPYRCPLLDEKFRIHKEDYYQKNGGIVIANPNAPTSLYESVDWIRDLMEHNQKSVVIVDEAYIDFAGESAISLISDYENLLVVQTFSKSRSMAGIRIGYAIGNERLIQALNDVKYSINSYTLNYPSIELGAVAVEEAAYYEGVNQQIVQTREEAKLRLRTLGFDVLDSAANFVFTAHKSIPGSVIFHALRKKNIFVRHFDSARIQDYIRITIGTPEQMEILYQELEHIVEHVPNYK